MEPGDLPARRLDEEFVRAARYREGDLPTPGKPSRESLREVKQEAKRRKRNAVGRRLGKPPLIGTVTIGVAVVAGVVIAAQQEEHARVRTVASREIPVVVALPSVTAVTSAPQPTAAAVVNPDPFVGSAVAHWPHGDAGLALPPARAVGAFTGGQVAEAYRKTAAFLHATMLDPAVVYRGSLAPVWATMSADSVKAWQAHHRTDKSWAADVATRFRPHGVVPTSYPTRMNGTLAASLDKEGRLLVTFHYVAVYAVRAAAGSPAVLVGVRHDGTTQYDRAGEAGLDATWLADSSYLSDRSECGRTWLHPGYTEVYLPDEELDGSATTGGLSPQPAHTFAILDPRADPSRVREGCITDTSSLP